MTKPHFETEYLQGPTTGFVDWVAGGNFDGYIQQKSIRFVEPKEVIVKIKVLDQSRYDGNAQNSEIKGEFRYTDKDTLTIKYGNIEMRGKILGSNREYIVFSVSNSLAENGGNEVYKLQ